MELNNFVSMDFLAGFAGTIVGVELIVYCTKELPIVKKIPTRIYTFLLAVIHLLIVKCVMGTFVFNLGNIYLLIINSLLISTMLCGGYDVAIGNIQMPQLTNGSKKDIKIKIESADEKEKDESSADIYVNYNRVDSTEEIISLSNRGRNSNINSREN